MIKLEQVHKYYKVGDEKLHVLNNVTLHIQEGEFVGIMGPSGSGKSTLMNILGFLDSKYEGTYLFNDKSVSKLSDNQISKVRNATVGFVFQDFNLIEQATVAENVRLPLLYHGFTARQTQRKVKLALEKVGLEDKLTKFPRQLSGGQKQRVAIARALVNSPKFIIADEPTGALDSKTSASIMEILYRLNREDGVTIVMVTHDATLTRYCTRVVHVIDGIVHEEVAVEEEEVPYEI